MWAQRAVYELLRTVDAVHCHRCQQRDDWSLPVPSLHRGHSGEPAAGKLLLLDGDLTPAQTEQATWLSLFAWLP